MYLKYPHVLGLGLINWCDSGAVTINAGPSGWMDQIPYMGYMCFGG